MAVKSYQELIVWQKAVDLAEAVYLATERFPPREQFGLSAQVRRAAVSVPSNIAEGQGRATTADFRHFLHIARGSLQEAKTQLILATRLRFLLARDRDALLSLTAEVGKLLNALNGALAN
jgi:four helix bundle protein